MMYRVTFSMRMYIHVHLHVYVYDLCYLGKVKWVEGECLGLLICHDLDEKCPGWLCKKHIPVHIQCTNIHVHVHMYMYMCTVYVLCVVIILCIYSMYMYMYMYNTDWSCKRYMAGGSSPDGEELPVNP